MHVTELAHMEYIFSFLLDIRVEWEKPFNWMPKSLPSVQKSMFHDTHGKILTKYMITINF